MSNYRFFLYFLRGIFVILVVFAGVVFFNVNEPIIQEAIVFLFLFMACLIFYWQRAVCEKMANDETIFVDLLTKFPNRLALERSIPSKENPKLVIVDIDEFGKMNDCYGKEACDEVLIYISTLLKDEYKNDFEIYRIGYDQFALLDDCYCDIDKYEQVAMSLAQKFKGLEFKCLGRKIEINCTIGFSLEKDMLLQKAFMALKNAKQCKMDFFCYFNGINKTEEYRNQIESSNKIKEALNNDAVVPYFQPIYNRDGQIAKYECLVRIIGQDNEILKPNDFIGASHRFRLYSEMEKVVLEKAFLKVKETKKNISINILARDMTDGNVSNFLVDKLREYDISEYVTIELLEEESIEIIDRVANFFAKMRRMGVKIAIDDFGTGYSNFGYLLKLKPNYIKIDGTLIKDIDTDLNSQAIVKAIVTFAKQLNIKTIAEYVHSKEVYDLCYEIGVDEFQGYYLGEPQEDVK